MRSYLIKKLLTLGAKAFGVKFILKKAWKWFLYPKLKEYVENNNIKEWDEIALKILNSHIDDIIDSI